MRSPPDSLEPRRPQKPVADWVRVVVIYAAVAVELVLCVVIGWPMIALVLAFLVFGAGVVVGYRGARSDDFERHVRRWLE